jgi:hypothetical protein
MWDDFPTNRFAMAVDVETDAQGVLAAVEVADRVVQVAFRVLVGRGERVVDGGGPAFFLEDFQDQLLGAGGADKAFDDLVAETQLAWRTRCGP